MKLPRLKEVRELHGWSQKKLAEESGVSRDSISNYETGQRDAWPATAKRLADALSVEIADLLVESPKAQAPQPSAEDSPELRRSVPEALNSYMLRRARSLEAELKDENSPHFKTAAAATLWVADLEGEAKGLADWAIEESTTLMPKNGSLASTIRDAFNIMGHLMTFHAIARKGKQRIEAMADQPDVLIQRRLEKAQREAQESERQLMELQAAGE